MHIIRASEGESVERTEAAIFIGGQVWGRPVLAEGASRDFNAQVVQFAPGARTRLHRHTSASCSTSSPASARWATPRASTW